MEDLFQKCQGIFNDQSIGDASEEESIEENEPEWYDVDEDKSVGNITFYHHRNIHELFASGEHGCRLCHYLWCKLSTEQKKKLSVGAHSEYED